MRIASTVPARRAAAFAAAAALLAGPAALPAGAEEVPAANGGLHTFASCDELVSYVQARAPRLAREFGFTYTRTGAIPQVGEEDSAGAPASGRAEAPAAPDHSETNNQEAGVDEPDLVKTDGKRMFVLDGGSVAARARRQRRHAAPRRPPSSCPRRGPAGCCWRATACSSWARPRCRCAAGRRRRTRR